MQTACTQEFSKRPDENVLALWDVCLRTHHSEILVDRGLKHRYRPKRHIQVLPDFKRKKITFLLYFLFFFWKSVFSHCCSRSYFNLKTPNGCDFADAAHSCVSPVDTSVLKTDSSWNSDSVNSFATFLVKYSIVWFSPSSCSSKSTKHTDSNAIWKSSSACDNTELSLCPSAFTPYNKPVHLYLSIDQANRKN